ncbi:MAG TPA: flagellar hook-basal body complex protein FliE [Syntrophales bacterium]|nr:flagellar hook-basal body complex protein FliE [Syntrophales bacterium]HON22856.1 flagellar hook-basal body complex protein FliE [Syntrophales bacterium]HOU77063.1 flagellar hook-basal body complex protein FliE [Syntrophales bacterium]HPC32924.1 flagellar hook-basal body complex protein FliE [Syntrophales bacterium]HQG35557.1 flagellar hook-basal body complex protein FliE [Syntrophales bacterium]
MKATGIQNGMMIPPLTGNRLTEQRPGGGSFSEALKGAIKEVNALQNQAEDAVAKIQLDNRGSIHEVIIAMEKADISFRTMMQVRNKVLDAYQEIMRMTV